MDFQIEYNIRFQTDGKAATLGLQSDIQFEHPEFGKAKLKGSSEIELDEKAIETLLEFVGFAMTMAAGPSSMDLGDFGFSEEDLERIRKTVESHINEGGLSEAETNFG